MWSTNVLSAKHSFCINKVARNKTLLKIVDCVWTCKKVFLVLVLVACLVWGGWLCVLFVAFMVLLFMYFICCESGSFANVLNCLFFRFWFIWGVLCFCLGLEGLGEVGPKGPTSPNPSVFCCVFHLSFVFAFGRSKVKWGGPKGHLTWPSTCPCLVCVFCFVFSRFAFLCYLFWGLLCFCVGCFCVFALFDIYVLIVLFLGCLLVFCFDFVVWVCFVCFAFSLWSKHTVSLWF